MIGRVLAASARHRPGYLATVLVATAAAATALATAAGLGMRLHAALAGSDALGANVLVRPEPGGPSGLPVEEGERIRTLPGVAAVVPWAELGDAGGRPLLATSSNVLALHRGWSLYGRWPGQGETIAGAATGLATGNRVDTPTGARIVTGVLATGEAFDDALLVDLDATRAATLAPFLAQRFELRADPRRVEAVAAAVTEVVAGAEARPLLRVTRTRANLVVRLTGILAGAGALTALLAFGTLSAASLAQLHARRRELALFFALGYSRSWVSRLLTLELLAVGLVAWLLGAVAGKRLAATFAEDLLGAGGELPFATDLWGAVVALLGAALVLALTVRATARRLADLEPAALLAGR